jgi:ADP-ribose pyrophosphatase YjhB (NUDIX family)
MNSLPSLQLQIVQKLYGADRLRYSAIRPSEVENDLFNYHLQSLVKRGFGHKGGGLYWLSLEGLQYINKHNPIDLSGVTPDLFLVCVLTFVIREIHGVRQILHQARTSQPFYGDTAVPGGKVRHGEKIVEAASRKLFEECGLRAEFSLGGVIRVSFEQNNEFLQDILFHVCFTDRYTGELLSESIYGRNYWTDLDQAISDEQHNHAPIPAMSDLYEKLKTIAFSDLPFFYCDECVSFRTD